MFVAAMLMVLPAMAQTFVTQQAEQPNAAFQSTSTMMSSGSTYSANPTLNSDGTASYNGASSPAKTSGGPHRVPPVSQEDHTPLGDAVLPLLLMSLAFCAFISLRRRKTVKG